MPDPFRVLELLAGDIEAGQQPDYAKLARLQALDLAAFGVEFMQQTAADQQAADTLAFGPFPENGRTT